MSKSAIIICITITIISQAQNMLQKKSFVFFKFSNGILLTSGPVSTGCVVISRGAVFFYIFLVVLWRRLF